jgi:hypothetical protein
MAVLLADALRCARLVSSRYRSSESALSCNTNGDCSLTFLCRAVICSCFVTCLISDILEAELTALSRETQAKDALAKSYSEKVEEHRKGEESYVSECLVRLFWIFIEPCACFQS